MVDGCIVSKNRKIIISALTQPIAKAQTAASSVKQSLKRPKVIILI